MKIKDYDNRRKQLFGDYLITMEAYLQEIVAGLAYLRKRKLSETLEVKDIDNALRTIGLAFGRTSLPAELRKPAEASEQPIDETRADKQAQLDNMRRLRIVR